MAETVQFPTLGHTPRQPMIDLGVYREDLRFEVISTPREESKRESLGRLLEEVVGPGIIYVSTIKDCEAVTDQLDSLGFKVARYHARLGARERTRNQVRFMAGEVRVMVATNAFGMEIDKPDIRFVIHYNLPGTLDAYYQEAGRAGGDGEPARCLLFYQQEDRNTQVFFLNARYPKPAHFALVYKALERLGAERRDLSAGEIHERASSVVLGKLRVVLTTMKDLGIVAEPEPGLFRLTRSGLSPEELEAMAGRYEHQADADRDKLRRMVLYAQTALCRWKALLDYFGEEPEWTRCGHCDNCSRPIRELAAPPPADLPIRPQTATEVLPLPPLVGDRRPETLVAGDAVTLPIFGAGLVRSAAARRLVITFKDGETREFRL